MKHVMKTTKKKLASMLALMLAVKHLSGPALAAETPEETPVVVPDQSTAGQTVIIPESDYIYVNGSNKVFTADGELSVLMRLTVTNPGRVHILTSGVDITLVLYDEAADEVRGVFTSENGLMDASFDASVGTYLLGFSGWGEAAVLAADEAKTAEIFAESGVQSKPAAEVSAETASSGEAGADASDEAAAEAPAPAEPAPIAIRLPGNETTSLLPFLTAAGLPVKSVVWVDGNIDGRLVSAGANGDWLLTPLTYFDSIELKGRTSDAELSDPSGKITVYTVLISNPDPAAEQTEETEETEEKTETTDPEVEAAADEIPEEETPNESSETPADETTEEQADETTEEETEEETATDSSNAESEADSTPEESADPETTEETEDVARPITYQAEHTKTFRVLPVLTDAGVSVNIITDFSGDMEGKLSYIFQDGDLILTPYTYFDSVELTVTATDYLLPDSMSAAKEYTVIISNPDPNAVPPEDDVEDETTEAPSADSAPMNITISMERGEGNAVHLFAEDMQLNSADNYSFQWQASRDNEQWFDVEGATEAEYDFTLDETNSKYYWRLVINHQEYSDPAITG